MNPETDTIAALSTPHGVGGIAVIRISGPESQQIIKKIFQGDIKQSQPESHRVYHGWIADQTEKIDEVMVVFFQEPNSYTGEDVIEISCHGSTIVTKQILNLLIRRGARPAQPGEFTKRSFLNGKMDLSQAEAVADLIHAKTEASRRVALYQLEGNLSGKLTAISNRLVRASSFLELELDFAEENIEFAPQKKLKNMITGVKKELDKLLHSYERGRLCREGVKMAIIGSPNVGKSSILNCLVEKERAIVTEIPGTTRDTIEDLLDIEGVLFTITDTAGIREAKDPIEKEGVKRAEKALKNADIVLLVVDGSKSLNQEDRKIIDIIKDKKKKFLCIVNKSDLDRKVKTEEINNLLNSGKILSVSALNKQGIDELINNLKRFVISGDLPMEGEFLLTRERHRDAIAQAREHIIQAEKAMNQDMSQEFIAFDLRQAMDSIDTIKGKKTTADILDFIFSEFCIGK